MQLSSKDLDKIVVRKFDIPVYRTATAVSGAALVRGCSDKKVLDGYLPNI